MKLMGLKASRLRIVLSEIRNGFSSSSFSLGAVSLRTGMSRRYIQVLLHEAGASFTERILQLRLEKSLRILGSPSYDAMRISEVSLTAGFNDVSHFNRCFRRRFWFSPGSVRSKDI